MTLLFTWGGNWSGKGILVILASLPVCWLLRWLERWLLRCVVEPLGKLMLRFFLGKVMLTYIVTKLSLNYGINNANL
jgi:hypothetical protein